MRKEPRHTTDGARGKRAGRASPIDGARASQLVAVVAAVVVVVLLNVVAARRFARWDWTVDKRYTLSVATVQTLHDLPDTVQIWVLLGPADPLEQSVEQLLVAYRAETTKLEIHTIDPDRDMLAFEDVHQRFKIESGRTEDGHVVADAVVVVAHGGKHWFLSSSDMVEIAAQDDTRVKPREERALTGAIRSVLDGSKTRVCFTTGHGEASPLDPGDQGAGALKEVLEKDNYEVAVVDLAAPNRPKPLEGCGIAVVAGLRGAFAKEEAERLRTWVLDDGNLFVAAGPIFGGVASRGGGADENPARASAGRTGDDGSLVPAGLERVLAPFGIALDDDIVAEQDPELAFPGEDGVRFVAHPRQHAVTTALVKTDRSRDVPRVVVNAARSMRRAEAPGSASAQELLGTSGKAFGLRSIEGAATWRGPVEKRAGDLDGPLAVAMASERAKIAPSAPHGPRVVVIGTASVVFSPTFREPLPFRGGALLVESAIAWLSAKPQVLDVPEKAAASAGVTIDEASRGAIRRYVVLFMPATVALLGIAIALFRRAGEGAPRRSKRMGEGAASRAGGAKGAKRADDPTVDPPEARPRPDTTRDD